MLNFYSVLAEEQASGGIMEFLAGNGGSIIMIVGLIAVFYFLMYRPQKKQEKEAQEMKNNLAVGDEITTIGGIIGEIVSIKDETCVIETTKDKTKIRILKSAISRVDIHAKDKQ